MGLKILIVEDEMIIAADLERKLNTMGHQVVATAGSGDEAIRFAEDLRPELVFMDIQLQGHMQGLEVARRVQSITGASVIFATAYAEIFIADATQMQPPALCLSKPFSTYQLQAAINVVLDKRRS
jgi:CheY-like chemotaxis protein